MKMFLKNCDFISPEITLHFQGETHHSSIFSGIASIILFILALSLSIFFSLDLLFKKNPTMFSYERTYQDNIIFPLNSSAFFHYISILNKNNNSNIYNRKLFTVMGVQSSTSNINLYLNNTDETFSHWIYEKCDEREYGEENSYIFRGDKNKYKIINYNNGLCISKYYDKDNNTILFKNDSNFNYPYIENSDNKFYIILLRNCINNSIINNNNCLYIDSFNDFFENEPQIYLNFFSAEIELKNYKNPIIYDIKNVSIIFDYESYIIFNNVIFNPITIETNEGYIFDVNKKDYTVSFESSIFSYKYINSDNYLKASFIISSSKKNIIYERVYKKIQDIAGAVDGFTEILIILIDFLNRFIFHDFQVIHDYADIIQGHVKKYKISQKYIFSNTHLLTNQDEINRNKYLRTKKRVKFNTFITKNDHLKFFNDPNTLSNLTIKSNISLNKLPNTFQKKLSGKYHDFGWFEFLINRFNKYYPYINYLKVERKRMFSEERFFANYEDINNLKEYIQKNNNNIINNFNQNNKILNPYNIKE